jgi:hypothetical protein
MTLIALFRLLDSKIKWIGLGLVGPVQTSMKEAAVNLSRGLQNLAPLKFRRCVSVVSRAKSSTVFSLHCSNGFYCAIRRTRPDLLFFAYPSIPFSQGRQW